jgi:hypothetical protein
MIIIPPAFRFPTLLFVGAFASLAVFSSPASAVVVTVDGTQYDLDVFDGPYLGNESLFSSVAPGEMPWWGDEAMAIDFLITQLAPRTADWLHRLVRTYQ